ncbi:MAG: queuosine salvage family protein, partial [Planctomycetota bacterium]
MNASLLERVRNDTARVASRAETLRIDREAAGRFAASIAKKEARVPAWDRDRQWTDGTPVTAEWVFVLDSLNFCFWPDPGRDRWTVEWGKDLVRGYFALSCALKRAQERGIPITEAGFCTAMTEETLGKILQGHGEVPLLGERAAILRENGSLLQEKWGGRFSNLLRACDGKALRLVETVFRDFPSFRDVQLHEGTPVHFLKRAQILASDLGGAFGGEGLGCFTDMKALTAFADYRLPQILRSLGILVYGDDLADRVDREEHLPAGSR